MGFLWEFSSYDFKLGFTRHHSCCAFPKCCWYKGFWLVFFGMAFMWFQRDFWEVLEGIDGCACLAFFRICFSSAIFPGGQRYFLLGFLGEVSIFDFRLGFTFQHSCCCFLKCCWYGGFGQYFWGTCFYDFEGNFERSWRLQLDFCPILIMEHSDILDLNWGICVNSLIRVPFILFG